MKCSVNVHSYLSVLLAFPGSVLRRIVLKEESMKASIIYTAPGRLTRYSKMENETEVNASMLDCGDLPDVNRIKV